LLAGGSTVVVLLFQVAILITGAIDWRRRLCSIWAHRPVTRWHWCEVTWWGWVNRVWWHRLRSERVVWDKTVVSPHRGGHVGVAKLGLVLRIAWAECSRRAGRGKPCHLLLLHHLWLAASRLHCHRGHVHRGGIHLTIDQWNASVHESPTTVSPYEGWVQGLHPGLGEHVSALHIGVALTHLLQQLIARRDDPRPLCDVAHWLWALRLRVHKLDRWRHHASTATAWCHCRQLLLGTSLRVVLLCRTVVKVTRDLVSRHGLLRCLCRHNRRATAHARWTNRIVTRVKGRLELTLEPSTFLTSTHTGRAALQAAGRLTKLWPTSATWWLRHGGTRPHQILDVRVLHVWWAVRKTNLSSIRWNHTHVAETVAPARRRAFHVSCHDNVRTAVLSLRNCPAEFAVLVVCAWWAGQAGDWPMLATDTRGAVTR